MPRNTLQGARNISIFEHMSVDRQRFEEHFVCLHTCAEELLCVAHSIRQNFATEPPTRSHVPRFVLAVLETDSAFSAR